MANSMRDRGRRAWQRAGVRAAVGRGRLPAGAGRAQAETLEAVAAEVSGSVAVPGDAGDPLSLGAAFRTIATISGRWTCFVQRGVGAVGTFQEITAEGLEAGWRVDVVGILVAGQAVVPDMLARGGGAIVVTGARDCAARQCPDRGLRLGQGRAAVAGAVDGAAFGSKGVHVGCVIVDGVIDLASTRARMTDKPDDFFLEHGDRRGGAFPGAPRALGLDLRARPTGHLQAGAVGITALGRGGRLNRSVSPGHRAMPLILLDKACSARLGSSVRSSIGD